MAEVEDDFSGYVGARWPSLVRTLVLLGCPIELAPDVVTTGLSRCRHGWREAAVHDDVEVVVHRAVLDSWDERLRDDWWSGLRPRTDEDWPLPDLSALDRLTPEVRAGLVLRRFSSLDVTQAAAIAGSEAGGPLPPAPDSPTLVAMAESIVVLAPPPDSALVEGVRRRRRPRVLPVVGVLGAVLLLGGGTWWANRGDDDPASALAAVAPIRERNDADVAWYADEVLHLTHATYRIPGLRTFEVLGSGAVYLDEENRVVLLSDDGTRTGIGKVNPDSEFVASDERGQVAWVTGGAERPRLVVHDIGQGEVIGELGLPASESGPDEPSDTRALAFDDEIVYYVTRDGWGAWVPSEQPEPVDSGDELLVDVASRTRVFQADDSNVSMVQPFFNASYVVPGRGGWLSADGNYFVTRSPADGAVLVYDTRSGEPIGISPPFDPDLLAAAVPAPDLSVTYLGVDPDAFPRQEGSDSLPPEGQIVSCRIDRLRLGECGEPVRFVVRSGPVLLGD